jgi:hypothetical protein
LSISWETVATAAATAVLVTLVVEEVAKPRLEARKERHLETLRTRRDLVTAVVTITMAARMSVTELPGGAEDQLRRRWRDEQQRHHGRLQTLVTELFDNLGRYAAAYPEPIRRDLIRYVVCMRGVMLSSRPQHVQADILRSLGRPAAAMVAASGWRPGAASRARAELIALIERTEATGDAAPR